MNNKNYGYDEMQKAERGRIGNQMFMILFFALMLNVTLRGLGLVWLGYPDDIIVIASASVFVYVIRLIKAGAYLPTGFRGRSGKSILAAGAVFIAAAVILLVRPLWLTEILWEGVAIFTMISLASGIYLFKALVVNTIKKKSDGGEDV